MGNVKIDWVFRCETALGIKFGPEIECELHAEYVWDHDYFELVQLDCDNISMTLNDKARTTEMHCIWDKAQDALDNDMQTRTDAWLALESELEGA